ncbi:MAG: leucine-rich repeat protein [Clostridia bacterium]|nr:leucine-rich repeat protein [Clostridia bacterium]
MNVTTDGQPTLTYTWFVDETKIDGATGASYAVTAGNVGEYTYKCEVSDGTNTKEVPFAVTVDNAFSAQVKGEAAKTVFMGAAATLEVEAACATGDRLSYKWTRTDAPETVLGTEAAYTTVAHDTVGEYGYTCEINDGYGSDKVTLSFTVNVVNAPELTSATALQAAFTVAPTGSATLEVQTECAGAPTLTYAWYAGEATDPIDGANEASYAVTVGNVGEYTYKCQVSDGTNTKEVTFTVTVDNGLTASASGEAELTVTIDEAAELAVEAGCTKGEPTYRWFEGESSEPIEGAESASYSVTKSEAGTYTYRCEVGDAYGSAAQSVAFTVTVTEPDLVVTAEVEDGYFRHAENGRDYVWTNKDGNRHSLRFRTEAESDFTVTVSDDWMQTSEDGNTFGAYTGYVWVYIDKNLTGAVRTGTVTFASESTTVTYTVSQLPYLIAGLTKPAAMVGKVTLPGEDSSVATLPFEGIDLAWNAVDGATRYEIGIITPNNLMRDSDGDRPFISYTAETAGSSFTAQVAKSMLEPGGKGNHRVFLWIYDAYGHRYANYYDFTVENEANPDWKYIYQREGDAITGVYIQGYKGDATELVIPATIDGYPVVAIDEWAFEDNDSITGVTIPNGVTTIWNGAFSGCAALRSIVVPDSIETIRDNAFDGCNALKDIQVTEGTYAWNWFNDHGFFESEGILESDHPYESNSNETWTYTHPEAAEALEVTFSAKTELEDECDYLYISDANGDEKMYTGSELSGRTIAVMGNSFTIRLKSDGSVEEYGFKILSVTPATGLIDAWTDNPSIKVEPGNAVSMKVQVSYVGDVTLSYVWHDPNGAVIESAATSTCTVAEPKSGTYNCVVSDTNGNSKTVDFAVSMDNCLTAQAKNGNPFIMVLPGSNTTLEVEVQGIDLTNLTYQWQKWTETEDDDWSWMNLPGMNDATLPLENIQEQANYICVVQDRYGTSINVDFEVRLIEQSNIADLPLGETTNSEILNASGVIYRIAADNPGFYRFTASNDYGYTMSGVLMDANWNIIATDRQWSTRVSLIRQLDAGNYYFTVCFEGEELTGTITACAEYMPIQKLELDTPATVSISKGGQSAYFSFTPEETGYYAFSSSADSDTYGYLYDDRLREIAEDDDSGEGSNFKVMQQLTAGATYYFGARYYDSGDTGSFDVLLERAQGLISASTEQSQFTVAPETEVTMQVKTVCTEGETVSYQWFLVGDSGPESIEGETQPTYTVTVTRAAQYRCEVSDTHGNMKTVQFWINVDNGLQARRVTPAVEDGEDDTIHANMGDAVALAVEASCNEGTPSYQWYEAGERIEGANSASYTTKPIHRERTEVYCRVSDDYGNTRDVWFYIYCDNYVDNDLQVSAVNDYISVTPEETATLQASVTANDLTDATARWFYRPRTLNEQGEWDEGEWIALGEAETVEADGGEATLSRTLGEGELHSTNYRCEVSDKYGNTAAAEFSVAVDTGLSMNWDWENTQRSVPYGEPATLTSRIEKDWEPVTVEGLGYTWYKRNGDQFERIDGQTGASYTIPSVTWRDDYKCVAVDAYWNRYGTSEFVGVENDLNVRAANGETIFAVPYGGQLTLAVEASCLAGQDALQYQWSGWKLPDADRVDFTEVTGDSYVIDAVTEDWAYSCDVTDIYGDTKNVEFSVTIIDPNEAQALELGVPDSRHIDTDWAEGALYTYTPEDTGLYTFIEVGDEDNRYTPRYVAAYDSAMNKIDREEGQYEVSLTCLLTAGEKYYFKAGNCIRYPDYDLTVVLNKDNRSESATELALDTPANVNITEDGQTVYFSFTPAQTGYYAFSSENDSGNAARGSLYDGNFRVIESKTGWNNFSLAHQLVQGNTYYYGAAFDNDDCQGSYTVKLARIQGLVDASTEQSNFAVAPNTQVTLQVNAVCTEGETLGYQWYRISDEDEALDGETGDSYTLTVVQYDRFMCIVTDAYGNSARVEFEVSVDNGLQARRVSPAVEDEESDTIHANMGEAVALAVEASCNDGAPRYQWYEAGERIEGANSEAYTTKPIHREETEVYCRVSDDYGNARNVWFYIDCDNYVDNNLQAWAVSDYISVTPEETATLEASVSANDLTGATAQWFYRPRTLNDHGDWDEGEWESLGEPEAFTAEGTEATVTRALSDGELHTTNYRCVITDKYGNEADAEFYVSVDSGMSVEWDWEKIVTKAPYGSEATLAVQDPGEGVSLTWYSYTDETGRVRIEGETGTSLTVSDVTGRKRYEFVAADRYWNSTSNALDVTVENHLTAEAVGDSDVSVAPNGRATLAVNASSDDNSHTYRWSKEVFAEYEGGGSGWQRIYFDDANGATLTTDEITENIYYYCEVRDSYGTSVEVDFYVRVNNELSVQARDGKTTIRAFSGDDAALAVEVTAIDAEGLMLKWQKYSEYEGYTEIEVETGNELTLKAVSESARYRCSVTDAYGNNASVEFYVEVIDASNVTALMLNEPVSVTLEEDETALFSYECVKTGVYQFGSSENDDLTTRGELYDADWSTVAYDTNGGMNRNFRLLYRLEAGTKYYFGARYEYPDSGSFQVCLEEALFMESIPALTLGDALTFDTDETDKTVAFTFTPSESGIYDIHFGLAEDYTISVYDAAMHKLPYDGTRIVREWQGDGKYHVRLNAEAGENYTVVAEYANEYGADSFTVEAERIQGLYDANFVNGCNFTVAPGEQVTLEVYTKCTDDVPLTFEWYREGEETPISGANGPTYSLTVTRHESYKCDINDAYGHNHYVWFWIDVDNGLQARRVSPAVEDEEDDTIHANMGNAVALAVEASCNEGTPSYQWYEAGERIEGANSAAYTTKPIRREETEVYCRVSDDYGNTRDVWFYIDCDNYVDNNLQAWAVSDYISVTPEETATLEASVSANDLTDATAQWFYRPRTLNDEGYWHEDEWVALGEKTDITAEGGSAALTRALSSSELFTTSYRCSVTDKYGNIADAEFNVDVSTDLSVWNEIALLIVKEGNSIELEPKVQSGQGNVSYAWYRNDQIIEGANQRTYTVRNVTEDNTYYCRATDEYYNMSSADFRVCVVNPADAVEMTADTEASANIPRRSSIALFKFTPEKTANYTIHSNEDVEDGTFGYLFDSNLTEIEWADSNNVEGNEFQLTHMLEAGKLYYIGARFNDQEVTGPIKVQADLKEELNITPISLNGSTKATIAEAGHMAYFSYTPEQTGYYAFSSSANSDTFGHLYDDRLREIATDDDSGEDENFKVMRQLTAGATYYFGARYLNSGDTGSFDVLLERVQGLISASAEQSDLTVAPNTEVTMRVNAEYTEGENVSYQWFLDGESGPESIDGETQPTYTVTVTRAAQYRCEVSDTHGNRKTVQFWINIENGLQARRVSPAVEDEEDDTIHANMGEAVALAVEASCNDGKLSYQWYEAGDEIEGANSAAYTTKPIRSERTAVYCHVSDDYGNTRDVWFYIDCDNYVENNLQASAVNGSIYATPTDGVTLQASVSADKDLTGATVQWFYQSMTLNDQGEWEYGEWAALGEPEAFTAEGRQAALTRALGDAELHSTNYRCVVVDQYANEAYAYYTVQVENTDATLARFDYDNLVTGVPYGEPAVLKTKLDGEPTGDLNYTWYQEEETWARIDDQNGSEFTTPPVTVRKAYRFVVTDRYWNRNSDYVYVSVENHLSANAVGDSDVYVAPKGSVTLAVDASCDDGTLYYQWVRQVYSPEEGWTDQIIENGTGATCTIDPVTTNGSYYCRVSDRASNTAEVCFNVIVDNQLTARARDGVEEFTVSSGDNLTLEVEASAVDADSIGYEWQEARCGDDNEWVWTELEDQNSATLALENITDKAKFQCTVSDSYGSNVQYAFFTVNVIDLANATPLTLGTDADVTINDPCEWAMFSFTPDEDGLYLFTASENGYESLVGTVYDANLNILATDNAGGTEGEFRVTRQLQADTLYYLSARYHSEITTGSFRVRVDPFPVTALTVGEAASANIDEDFQIAYFSFTPAQTGYYSFESLADNDTYGHLYDENLQELAYNDDDGENGNFYIMRELTAGAIYHFGARYYGAYTGSFSVLLKRYQGLVSASAAQESVIVVPGTEATLKVDAICTEGETLSYQWYLDGALLDGATTDSYTLEPTGYASYKCVVSDAFEHSREIWFYVNVDNALTAQAVGESELSVSMGETVQLAVTASCTAGELSYQWYEDYSLIEGATQASYTTKPFNRSSAYYECCVTDQYGASANVSFSVECGDYIDNQFQAWTDASSIEVSPTEQTTLQVDVSANDMEGVTYRWSYLRKSLDVHGNMVDGEWVSIPEANEASYTLSGADAFTTTYRCEVSDKYWNTANVDISVLVNSELTTDIDGEHSNANVFYGETATLVVTASDADAIIHWYENRENDWYYIETSEDGRLVIPEATADVAYRWVAIDRYLRTAEGYVDVNVENDLNVTVANGLDKIAVPTGNDVALALAISSLSGPEALSYQWYRLVTVGDEEYSYQEWQAIEGANERQYTVAYVTEDGQYRCDISDRCGGWTQVEFTVVCVDNTGVTALALREEQSVTLENVGQQAMFSYTPDKTDMYVFESSNNDYRTLRGAIFDADWNNIASNLAGGPDNNFRTVYRLEAGQPYYFGAWHESEETGSFTVRLDRYDVTGLTEGVSAQATISGEGQRIYYSFTPQETGYYAFASSGAEYATIGYRYDGAMQETMGETGWNDFSIRCKLEQGETYYFAAAFNNYSDTGSFDVCMTALHGLISAEGENSYLYVAPETEVSLRVNAECAREGELADLSYQWTREGEAIEGATTAEYTLTVTESASFSCTVSDNQGNSQDVSFYVSLNNEFGAWAETDSSPSVNMGETATLSVAATCRVGGLSYQWYRENEPIEGANEPSYTTGPISEYTNYYCAVSDEYGASDNVYFYVNCIEG